MRNLKKIKRVAKWLVAALFLLMFCAPPVFQILYGHALQGLGHFALLGSFFFGLLAGVRIGNWTAKNLLNKSDEFAQRLCSAMGVTGASLAIGVTATFTNAYMDTNINTPSIAFWLVFSIAAGVLCFAISGPTAD